MNTNLTNLLSFERIRAFRRDYFLRLLTVLACIAIVIILAQAALLIPTYLYANEQATLHRSHLSEIERANASEEERSVTERLTSLTNDAERALGLVSASGASASLRSVLALPRPGIIVNRFAIASPSATETTGRISVSGIATTRDALREYHLALSSLSFVASADLPLGSYAKESEIPFTITLQSAQTP